MVFLVSAIDCVCGRHTTIGYACRPSITLVDHRLCLQAGQASHGSAQVSAKVELRWCMGHNTTGLTIMCRCRLQSSRLIRSPHWLEQATAIVVAPLSTRCSLVDSAIDCRLGHRPEMKRGSASSGPTAEQREQRRKVEREIVATGNVSRGALVECLVRFRDAGMLSEAWADDGDTRSSLRKEVENAVGEHARAKTPYGPVVQTMDLGVPGLREWEYVSPFAYLHRLSSIGPAFASMMKDCIMKDPTAPLRLIVYIDEIQPGNPLRPGPGRNTQGIYWAFADWPAWALQRDGVWLLFGVVRSKLVADLPGGVSQLMRRVLNIFYAERGDSFARGCVIPCPQGSVLLRASFAGFLSDEKAHKEILQTKGAAGTKPCVSCKNVVQFCDIPPEGDEYLQGISCVDYRKLDYHTNEDWFVMADMLEQEKPNLSKAAFGRLEQSLGLSYNPDGLLWDRHLRTIIRPVDNCIRDWMHTMVSGGVAGTEMSLLLQALKREGVKYEHVQQYAANFHLPHAHGKLDMSCFSANRISEDQLRAFASEQLSMIPIVSCFLVDVINPMGIMPRHIKCFALLRSIIEILSLGPHSTMHHIETLRRLIVEHGELFRDLYPSHIKPKFHQALHLHEGMSSIGACLGCFVTERKHRKVKSAGCHIFRHYEHTVLVDLVNRQAEDFRSGVGFGGYDMVDPMPIVVGETTFLSSQSCALPCGSINKNDVLALSGKRLGRVLRFWAEQQPSSPNVDERTSSSPSDRTSSIAVEMAFFSCVSGDGTTWRTEGAEHGFAVAADALAPVVWAPRGDERIRAVLPAVWDSA